MAHSLTRMDSHGHSQHGLDLRSVQGHREPLWRAAGGLSVRAASEDGMGACPCLVAVLQWFGCSPGSGSPTLGPCCAADPSDIAHVPQAAFFCLLGALTPCGHTGKLPVTASPAAKCWGQGWVEGSRLNWAGRLRERKLHGVCASGWSTWATSFLHFLLGAEGTSGGLTPEPLPAANALKSPGSCSCLKLIGSSASSVLSTENIQSCWWFLWLSPRSLQPGKQARGVHVSLVSEAKGRDNLVWASIPLPQRHLQCGFDRSSRMKGILEHWAWCRGAQVQQCWPSTAVAQQHSPPSPGWSLLKLWWLSLPLSLFIYWKEAVIVELLMEHTGAALQWQTYVHFPFIFEFCPMCFCGFQVKEDFVF